MIVPTYSDAQILKELHEDLRIIKENARKVSKKKLIKIVASGMTSKEYIDDYEVISPNHNRWFVTNSIKANRRGQITTRACCIVNTDKGKDYLIVRGTKWGGLFFLRVYAHVISRMKDRDKKKYKGMRSESVCNRIFQPHESAFMFYTNQKDVERFWTNDVKEDVNSMMVTESGVFFGGLYHDEKEGSCYIDVRTFITPELIATHEQHDMYRCAKAHMELGRYTTDKVEGNSCMSYVNMTPEAKRLMKIIEEYKTNQFFIDGMMVIPE
jgi:hypothetical protein